MLCTITTNRRFGNFLILCLLWLAFSATTALGNDKEDASAVSPTDGVIELCNSKNLDGLTTWLSDTKYKDPRGVFSIKDGILHITGDGFGYVRTNERYRDYHLVIEYKWGKRTWGNRKERARDSGVLVHCIGPDVYWFSLTLSFDVLELVG